MALAALAALGCPPLASSGTAPTALTPRLAPGRGKSCVWAISGGGGARLFQKFNRVQKTIRKKKIERNSSKCSFISHFLPKLSRNFLTEIFLNSDFSQICRDCKMPWLVQNANAHFWVPLWKCLIRIARGVTWESVF